MYVEIKVGRKGLMDHGAPKNVSLHDQRQGGGEKTLKAASKPSLFGSSFTSI